VYRNQGDFFEIGGVEFNEQKSEGVPIEFRNVYLEPIPSK